MALNDLERRRVERAVGAFIEARRPPPHLRPQFDLGFRVSGQSVELFEIRPRWDRPAVKRESPFAKATLVRSRGVWRVFWRRADRTWHGYQPLPEVATIEDFLAVAGMSCFARRPARARRERGGPGVSDDPRSCPHRSVAPVTGQRAEVATPRRKGYRF